MNTPAAAPATTASPDAPAAAVTVLSGGAVKSGMVAAFADWERRSGRKVAPTFAPAGEMRKRVEAGEVMDVLVVPSENLADYEKAGAIDPATRRDLAAVSIGVAVRAGAPLPDISTPEALKRALLAVKSVTYMDPERGTSGKHVDGTLLPRLGIRDAVRAKAKLGQGGAIAEFVASGEVEMAVHQMTEMLGMEGIAIVGPLPAELQKVTVYSGVAMARAANRAGAQALLDYLASPEGRQAFLDRGYAAP